MLFGRKTTLGNLKPGQGFVTLHFPPGRTEVLTGCVVGPSQIPNHTIVSSRLWVGGEPDIYDLSLPSDTQVKTLRRVPQLDR